MTTAALLCAVYISREIARDDLLESTEDANIAFTRIFLNQVWDQVAPLLPPAGLRDPDRLQARPETAQIDRLVRAFSTGTDLLKIKIYDLNGIILYSPDLAQIGENQSGNPGILSARQGTPRSSLYFRQKFMAFGGEVRNREIVGTYTPAASDGVLNAIVGIYTDRTDIAQHNHDTVGTLALILAPLFYLFFGIVFYAVWREDLARQKQQIELEKLVVDNAQARTAAEAANNAKSVFLATMSHEVRTPLTAIIGYAESSLDHNPSREVQAANNKAILRSGKHLLAVINDVLDLAKIESGKVELHRAPVNTFSLLRYVEAVSSAHANRKGLGFIVNHEFPLPETIVMDETRLEQILLNVANNAIKFTEKGSVSVNVSYVAQDAKLRIVVTDTGIGMTAEQLHRLFTPFSQGDANTNRRFGGTGLGLHISQRLASALGGSLHVTSVPGEGTTVEVLIDAGNPPPVRFLATAPPIGEASAGTEGRLEPPQLKGKLLLAEDNPDNQKLISLYVAKTGVDIAIAADGALALEQAMQNDYDLILMDIQMPVMDGMEATQLLRKTGYGGPIVALTASSTKEEVEQFTQAGCDAVLSKPIDWNLLYQTLANHLAARASAPGSAPAPVPSAQLRELMQSFMAGLPARMKRIRAAHARGDWPQLASALHDLKGMGGGFGYHNLTQIAATMETAVKEQNHDALARYAVELDRLVTGAVAGANANLDAVTG